MKSLLIAASTLTGLLALAMIEPPSVPPGHPSTKPQLPPGHPQTPPQLPAGHPEVDQDGQMPEVAADPADVATIDALLDAYYASISGPKGQPRDWDRFRSLFMPDARLISIRPTGPDQARPFPMSTDQYRSMNSAYFEQGGYFESDVHREIDRYGGIAQVFSTYESRRGADVEPYARGINGFQLVFDGQRWWVTTLIWQSERPDGEPIPAPYLPNADP